MNRSALLKMPGQSNAKPCSKVFQAGSEAGNIEWAQTRILHIRLGIARRMPRQEAIKSFRGCFR